MEPREGEPWPAGRGAHAACCLGYAGNIHLLVTGGLGRELKPLNNAWLFNLSSKKWKEVRRLSMTLSSCYKDFAHAHYYANIILYQYYNNEHV